MLLAVKDALTSGTPFKVKAWVVARLYFVSTSVTLLLPTIMFACTYSRALSVVNTDPIEFDMKMPFM